MTDRELLEMAAKAAGIKGTWSDRGQCIVVLSCAGIPELYWRPLEDDGDALRLAVKLQIQVTPGTYSKDEFSAFHAGKSEAHECRSYQQDDCASTRRAIVRAAAEIGKSMEKSQ